MNIKRDRKIIYLAGFLFSIPIALVSYINSSFLESYVGKGYIGVVYVVASIVAILALLEIPKVLNRLGNRKTIMFSLFLIFLSMFFMSLGKSIYTVIPAFVIYFSSISLVISSLDVFVEDFSKNSNIGTLRGFYLTMVSLAWILTQAASGSFIYKSSEKNIYLLSACLVLLVILVFIFSLHDFKDPVYKRVSIKKTFESFKRDKNLLRIYIINLVLQFFYAWMVIYTPIYLHEYMHFGWDKIGVIFSIMLLPFLSEFILGKYSDKIGEKKALGIGFLIMSVSVFCLPFIEGAYFWYLAIALFCTRVGAAMVEVMSESYFFKVVSEENADEISFFRNTPSIAYIIAPLLAIPIFLFSPSFKYLFFVLATVLLLGLFTTLRLKDVK